VAIPGLLWLGACEPDPDNGPSEEPEGVFFDEDLLFEGATDLATEELACVGESDRMLRGMVLAPDGRMALRSPTLLDRLMPTAHAAPLEGELPVAGVVVSLTTVDERGEPAGDPLVETETNAAGLWCVAMPDDVEFGPATMLIARHGEHRLRRPVLHGDDLDIYSQPEALVRLLVEEGLLVTEIDVDSYLNLDVMAQTAVDLLRPQTPRPGAGLDSLLDRLQRAMSEDARLMAAIERLYSPTP